VSIGATEWRTSVFPDSKLGTFLLPVKREVRVTEGLEEGDMVLVRLDLVDC
jgi:SOS-response transcriptional repressor LexA